jgi:undecaprenyl-diphosphatase
VHYPLDVAFGAIVGILSSLLVLKVGNNNLMDKLSHVCLLDKNTGKI